MLTLTAPYLAMRERSSQRPRGRADTDFAGQYIAEHGHPPRFPPRRCITSWSARSRSRMIRTLAEVDWTPLFADGRIPAMVTLTLPGDWLTVCPDGPVFKKQVARLRKRYHRAWGEPLAGAWKLEFQRRGAPHLHIFATPPHGLAGATRPATQRPGVGDGLAFRQWLSLNWADIVAHPDPEQYRRHLAAGTGVDYAEGLRAADPRRLAVYFAKHGSYSAKAYQAIVPPEWSQPGHGPGRFWGVWGLEKALGEVEVTPADFATLGRTLRRYSHAQRVTREVRAPRPWHGAARSAYPEVIGLAGAMLMEAHTSRRRRPVRRRAVRLKRGRGYMCANNAPALAEQLARVVTQSRIRRTARSSSMAASTAARRRTSPHGSGSARFWARTARCRSST